MNSKQVIEKIKEENISFVDFWFVDIFGELHCMGMPSYSLSENDFNDGLEKLDTIHHNLKTRLVASEKTFVMICIVTLESKLKLNIMKLQHQDRVRLISNTVK